MGRRLRVSRRALVFRRQKADEHKNSAKPVTSATSCKVLKTDFFIGSSNQQTAMSRNEAKVFESTCGEH
jgi:hypothetical protein